MKFKVVWTLTKELDLPNISSLPEKDLVALSENYQGVAKPRVPALEDYGYNIEFESMTPVR